jgi:predicted branched-subunit amino acid permease
LSFPLHEVSGRLRRAYAMFALIDEAYALTTARPAGELTSTRILAMQFLMHASWVGGGVAGALAGPGLPVHLPALDFVFTALLVVLAVALVARVAAPGQMLLLAMGLYCALLSGLSTGESASGHRYRPRHGLPGRCPPPPDGAAVHCRPGSPAQH